MQFKNILVTGGAGFIGSNFLNQFVPQHPDINFINVDCLTYAGNLENLQVHHLPNYFFEKVDIRDKKTLAQVFKNYHIDGVINFAAESHVDNSIENSSAFLETNMIGTQNLLDLARDFSVQRFHQVSTDEVYGDTSFDGPSFSEEQPFCPSNPYSASKAAADLLCQAYKRTFQMDITITRCTNNYGRHQFPEKFIPVAVRSLVAGDKIPVYGDGRNQRDWIYAADHCNGIWQVFTEAAPGAIYNLAGATEKSNLEVARQILRHFGKDESWLEFVADRPGHDLRYAIDDSKIRRELGWQPQHNFEEAFPRVVDFYKKLFTNERHNSGWRTRDEAVSVHAEHPEVALASV